MSDGSGSAEKGESSQTSNVNIPSFLRPLLGALTSTGQGLVTGLGGDATRSLVAPFTDAQVAGQNSAIDVAGGAGGFIPTAQNVLKSTAEGVPIGDFLSGFDDLSRLSGGQSSLPPEALAALQSTAGGDFLFGGGGFDKAVEAAIAAATPGIRSTFGGTTGGLSGVLAKQAVGDTAVNAFASQFANERSNQLGATNSLATHSGNDATRSLQAAGLLGDFSSSERDRQIAAAGVLPEAGLLSSNILRGIGAEQQNQATDVLQSPFNNQMALLNAIMGGFPLEALLGGTTNNEFSAVELGFG